MAAPASPTNTSARPTLATALRQLAHGSMFAKAGNKADVSGLTGCASPLTGSHRHSRLAGASSKLAANRSGIFTPPIVICQRKHWQSTAMRSGCSGNCWAGQVNRRGQKFNWISQI